MDKQAIISKTAEHVREELSGESSGHDWFHVYRVWKLAEHIGKQEGADMFIVEMTALLHDLDDFKITGEHSKDKKNATSWMENMQVGADTQQKIIKIIQNMGFTDHIEGQKSLSKEGEVVQDADRLDALGAIGIGRAFAYGGKMQRPLHDPAEQPKKEMSKEHYMSRKGTTINHFHEKLLLLKELMNTDAGRKMAAHRHQFMEQYLEEFFKEWEGER